MSKRFNTTGRCLPNLHYMVDISEKVNQICEYVQRGDYFVMNRARQFGKTTMLSVLNEKLSEEYQVFSISFEGSGEQLFMNETAFCRNFCRMLFEVIKYEGADEISEQSTWVLSKISSRQYRDINFMDLSDIISELCASARKDVVLMIDEVDQASGFKVFLDFLGMLRKKYLLRDKRPAFRSVILAGVYDIRNLRLKMGNGNEIHYNSPWNIAAEFQVDMSFSKNDIERMLAAYEKDHHTGMNCEKMSELIFEYTSGYPYLVSRICQLLDEKVNKVWTESGFLEAIKLLLRENNTLFDDIMKKLSDYHQLKNIIQRILFQGELVVFSRAEHVIHLGEMFGFLRDKDGQVAIANRIFETWMYDLFLAELSVDNPAYRAGVIEKNQFVVDGYLQMELVMKKFYEFYTEIYGHERDSFAEEQGRKLFLLFLKPIINGTGNYYVEAQTRDMKRTDIIIDYRGRREIIELKIWRGEEYNKRGEQQLFEYLDYYHVDQGYLLSFNFNKNKKTGIKNILYHEKKLMEVVV